MENRSAAVASIIQFLSSQSLFEGIDPYNLAVLARASRLKPVSKGSFLFFQSDPGEAVYLVWRGVITIRLENPDGRELVINEMGVGDCFGELAVLTGEPRSASAEAIVDSEVLLIPSQAFKNLLTRNPVWLHVCSRSRPEGYKTAASGKRPWHSMMPSSAWHNSF